jgi:hypothetical protein
VARPGGTVAKAGERLYARAGRSLTARAPLRVWEEDDAREKKKEKKL